jgi:hypothetical protein
MANVLSVNDLNAVRQEQREKTITYSVTLSGNYVNFVRGTNVGEVLNLNAAIGQYLPDQFWGNVGPQVVYPLNTGATGYAMSIVPGADKLHWLLVIFSGIAAQLAPGAYPAGLTTDLDIKVEARGRVMD